MLTEETRINRVAVVDQLLKEGLTCKQVAFASKVHLTIVYEIRKALREVDREQAALVD